MKRTRYTKEQIAFALRQAESGTPVSEAIRKMCITEPTFYRWKKQFAGTDVTVIWRLKQLEDENARLKKLVEARGGFNPGQNHVAGRAQKKVVKPVVRREVAGHLQKAYGISERRACSATGFQRSSRRYRRRSDPQVELRMRLEKLAAARVRYGSRRLHILLRREGWPVNHERPYRLYREEGLSSGPRHPSASGPGVIGRAGRRWVDPTRCGRWTSCRPAFRRACVPDPDGGGLPHTRVPCDRPASECPGLSGGGGAR